MNRWSALTSVASCVFCIAASATCAAQQSPDLPEGVIHVALPPGTLKIENIARKERYLIRVTVGKTVIESRTVFLGDGKGAQEIEATKEGMHWVSPGRKKGFVMDGVQTHEPGSTIGVLEGAPFLTVANLKAGSVYLTTP
jgi:hypothetical protein